MRRFALVTLDGTVAVDDLLFTAAEVAPDASDGVVVDDAAVVVVVAAVFVVVPFAGVAASEFLGLIMIVDAEAGLLIGAAEAAAAADAVSLCLSAGGVDGKSSIERPKDACDDGTIEAGVETGAAATGAGTTAIGAGALVLAASDALVVVVAALFDTGAILDADNRPASGAVAESFVVVVNDVIGIGAATAGCDCGGGAIATDTVGAEAGNAAAAAETDGAIKAGSGSAGVRSEGSGANVSGGNALRLRGALLRAGALMLLLLLNGAASAVELLADDAFDEAALNKVCVVAAVASADCNEAAVEAVVFAAASADMRSTIVAGTLTLVVSAAALDAVTAGASALVDAAALNVDAPVNGARMAAIAAAAADSGLTTVVGLTGAVTDAVLF